MNLEDLKVWIETSGYEWHNVSGISEALYIDYPGVKYDPENPKQVTGNRIRHVTVIAGLCYLNSSMYGIAHFPVNSQYMLKLLLDKS